MQRWGLPRVVCLKLQEDATCFMATPTLGLALAFGRHRARAALHGRTVAIWHERTMAGAADHRGRMVAAMALRVSTGG